MMATVTPATTRPAQPPQPRAALPQLYPGQTFPSKEGLISIITVLPQTDRVYYSVNRIGTHCKTQAGFCAAYMTGKG